MGQLHGAFEIAHLSGQHQPGALHQLLLEVLGVEKRRRHLRPAVAQGDDKIFPAGAAIRPANVGAVHLTDEGDVLTGFGWSVLGSQNFAALAVLPGIVPQQILNGADAERLLEAARRLGAENRLEPVGQ